MRYATSAGRQRRLTRRRETTNDSSVAQSQVRVGAKSCRRSTSVGCLISDFLFHHSPNPQNSLTSLSQIPPNNDSPDIVRSDCVTQNLAQCSTPLTQGGEIVLLSPVTSVMLNETQPTEIAIPPPAPGVGSSEYLPPYSPPHLGEQIVNQRATTTVVRQDQPMYCDSPLSYEEIFGQHGGC